MDVLKGLLLAVRFALELAAFAALAYWGFETGGSTAVKVLLGVGAPLVAIGLWALFVAPKARFRHPALKAVFEAVVFGAAALALVDVEWTEWALVFAAMAVVDGVLVRLLDL